MRNVYTKQQIEFLRQIIPGKRNMQIINLFKDKFDKFLTESQLHSLKSNHKIPSGIKGIEPKYTSEHFKFLTKNVPGKTDKEVVNLFNKTFDIKISEAKLGNLKTKLKIKNGLTSQTRFVKGQKSWNEGKTWQEFMSIEGQQNSLKTTFKKGHIPKNSVKIGATRLNKDGCIEIKIQDGAKNKNWKGKHRLIWEKQNGPIPKGHKIVFIDGNKNNFDINNLALVSNAEEVIINRLGILGLKPLFQAGLNLARIKIKLSSIRRKI